jgi:hypothetical protein
MINEKTTLKQILEVPGSEEVLNKHQVPCLFCPMAGREMEELTIGQIAEVYGLNLNEILKDLNALGKGR